MNFLNSIFYKSIVALYKLNINANGRSKNALIDAIRQGLIIGRDGLDKAKLEMALESATEDWLDYWGNFYGVLREYKENDDDYRIRIIEEILAPKNTIRAIQEATSRYVNRKNKGSNLLPGQVKIFEPWRHLLKLDSRGYIDGEGRLISYDYWNYAMIDITIPDASVITPDLIAYVKKAKAAGVQLVFSLSPDWDIAIDPVKDSRDTNIARLIEHDYYLFALNGTNAFTLRIDGYNGKQSYDELGHIIDKTGYLDGKPIVYWEGVKAEHDIDYATGVIRNHLGSAVLNLTDYLALNQRNNMTIEEAISFENDSVYALERLHEGKLTITLDNIDIKSSKTDIIHTAYIKYSNQDILNSFIFDTDNITKHINIDEFGNQEIYELNKLFIDNSIDTNTTNTVKTKILEEIEKTNAKSSTTLPLLIVNKK